MRDQPITRVVDALASQQRIILWLGCKHTVTISTLAAHDMTPQEIAQMQVGNAWPCPHCPDAPVEKTVRQARMEREYDSLGD
jgi:hypothetical protein